MESTAQLPVVQPQIIQDAPQPPTTDSPDDQPAFFPLWSKWVDSKGKLWIVVDHTQFQLIEKHHTAANVHCLDVAREFEQIFHILDLRKSLNAGKLTRLTGPIAPEVITQ